MAPLHENRSFPHLVYPSLRDSGLKDAEQWLLGKSMDDGAEGLWRVHDKLYDLTDFIKKHPGGEDWLKWTKGTDITEAFESHHISIYPEKLLNKFFVRETKHPRNSPHTFKDDGFYRTLKARAREELKTIPKNLGQKTKRLMEFLASAVFFFSIFTVNTNWLVAKVICSVLAGLFLAWTTVCAHNFFHQKDNWRMYLFNLSMMSFDEWRITHVLSHHLYTNTLLDFEISTFEPMFNWLPRKNKTMFQRFAPIFYAFVVYTFIFLGQPVKKIARVVVYRDWNSLKLEYLIGLTLPTAMKLLSGASLAEVIVTWLVIVLIGSFIFGLIGLNAAHHHPDIFHDGDAPPDDSDWGIHQLEAVMDRTDITGSHFRVMTHFGDHALHHMFPTLDHAILPYLYPVLEKTCAEFKTQLRMTTQAELLIGQFKQLARNTIKNKK